MQLHNLPKSEGIKRRKKRRGIGVGSGNGKTSGKGHKGQKARSGAGIPATFEGGQIPLARKLPYKRGRKFTNADFRTSYAVVNLTQLEKLTESDITREALVLAGYVRTSENLVKVLGTGEISRPINLTVNSISETAKKKIEAVGGTVTLI